MRKRVFYCIICILILLGCQSYQKRVLIPLNLNGVVESTWIDYNNHATRVIIVQGSDSLKEFYVIREENISFYEKIQKGDSIFKDANSLKFYLLRNGKKMKYVFNKYP
ncbi:hypothetical protein [Labilibaculum sp.]|uniref:hypothetical protein n=1 Tax=Labilibaculum sp. TaxID=2060723 RepID=UPI002AA631EE|nr:hypothetical protein [Labilibaculum sp.]MBN2597085.1 hypothetical protein [Marinifilaceae bacterium]